MPENIYKMPKNIKMPKKYLKNAKKNIKKNMPKNANK